MSFNKKTVFKELIIIASTFVVSFCFGLLFNDLIWGTLTLAFGFLNAYYMALGKWENYIYGILFTLTYAYICTINGLYGWLIFSIIFYLPVQIFGIVNWFKNKTDDVVEVKSFTLKNSIVICSSIIAGSVILGFLLSLIPSQNLAFLDSTSQIINISGVVLVSIRFKECWYVWIANNLIDAIIWIVNAINHTTNAEMALLTSIMFLVMNVVGLIYWIKTERKQKTQNTKI